MFVSTVAERRRAAAGPPAVLCLLASHTAHAPPPCGTVADKTIGEKLLGATVRPTGTPATATAIDPDGASERGRLIATGPART